MTDEPMRPDPDRLLEQTAEAHRGKLKIFFGACAGVGKTFAMLTEAQRLRRRGSIFLSAWWKPTAGKRRQHC